MTVSPPRIVFWESTVACNLSCRHCRRTQVPQRQETAAPPHAASPDERVLPTPVPIGQLSDLGSDLATAEAFELIDQLGAMGPLLFIISGGEPLLRADLYDVAARATSRGLAVAVATNATLIDASAAEALVASGVRRVSVSLDAPDAAGHDAFRGLSGSYAAALRGIAALQEAGMPVQINSTIARHNVRQLDELLAMARGLGAVALHLFLLVPVGCGLQITETDQIAAAEYERVLHWLYDIEGQDTGLELRATCAPHYHRVILQRRRREAEIAGGEASGAGGRSAAAQDEHGLSAGCLAGNAVAFVSHDGLVFGCGYLPLPAGSLREHSFADVWRDSALFADLRDRSRLVGKCHGCEFVAVCGGCRARAYGMTGDHLGEEPMCVYHGGRAETPDP